MKKLGGAAALNLAPQQCFSRSNPLFASKIFYAALLFNQAMMLVSSLQKDLRGLKLNSQIK